MLQKHHERLAALVGGSQAKQHLGKAFTADQIDAPDDVEIEKLYAHYEARLGAAMMKRLGSAALQLYAGMASMFFPIPAENQPALVAELEADPFVGHALSSLPPSRQVPGTANRCINNKEALSIWSSMPSDNKR